MLAAVRGSNPGRRSQSTNRFCVTVWFNAWKYQSQEEIWAGLIDSIVGELALRLGPARRELFFASLNLKRIDIDKVRCRIYDEILRRCVQWTSATWVAITSVAGPIALGFGHFLNIESGLVSSAAGALFGFATAFLVNKSKTEGERASVALKDVVAPPDYSAKAGFVHSAEVDLRRVLSVVPDELFPIVVFVDDLDRCLPSTVAAVMEGLNLFLGGDFPDFVFVLGMDSELVAAALDSSQKSLMDFLPADANVPLGWKFMDKFVQLPFVIPRPRPQDYERLLDSLLLTESNSAADSRQEPRASTAEGAHRAATAAGRMYSLVRDNIERIEDTAAQRTALIQTAGRYSEADPQVIEEIRKVIPYLDANPRELKRFLNSLRLHDYLAHVRGSPPTTGQIVKFSLLTVRWPNVLRWIRRAEIGGFDAVSKLQEAANASPDGEAWAEALTTMIPGLKSAAWAKDAQLFRFWKEDTAAPTRDRLSREMNLW